MKLLYGTGNPAKIAAMKRRLSELDIEIIGLRDLGKDIPKVVEDGSTPLENARKKALKYYEAFKMPVFSCDSGLYIDEIPGELQPGIHVRTINGKYLTDEEMLEYYSGLARKYGDLTARYRNAICLVLDNEHIYQAMEESMASQPFIITSVSHSIHKEGFPLDSLSIDIKSGKYYYDLEHDELDRVAVEDGFLDFFRAYCVNNKEV
ncbi:MAG: non-canonical purine NTP pyrophosphatase [Bacillota bacterium]|nr:non-canonical purine NTP pyrophosphatase [Bacillota bacterium]